METKSCFKCNQIKTLDLFYKHPEMPDGHVNKCKECNKKDNVKNWWDKREEKHLYDLNRHRYSVQRLFNHKYSMIKRRCEKGDRKGRAYFVTGKEYLSKDEWNNWCYQDENYMKFMDIYNNWVQSGFNHKKTPSIDRIDSKKSYLIGNLQWLTLSANCSKYNK